MVGKIKRAGSLAVPLSRIVAIALIIMQQKMSQRNAPWDVSVRILPGAAGFPMTLLNAPPKLRHLFQNLTRRTFHCDRSTLSGLHRLVKSYFKARPLVSPVISMASHPLCPVLFGNIGIFILVSKSRMAFLSGRARSNFSGSNTVSQSAQCTSAL